MGRYTINNDGLRGWRNRMAIKHLRAGSHRVKIEMFERGGHAGMLFRYMGSDELEKLAVCEKVVGQRKIEN